ncbi:MAG: SMR family transporter [Nanoarchaeota archaeon]|nr:SMR family transporter [Nanoarchaeota archaeon]
MDLGNAKLLFFLLLSLGVLMEVAGDILMKRWTLENRSLWLVLGISVYVLGSVFWLFSLKYEALSKAGAVFMVLNLILITLAGVLYFKEGLSLVNKIGIGLGILSVILIEL